MNLLLKLLGFVMKHKTLVALIGGALMGLLLGWLVFGVLQPVEFINAAPTQLRTDFRDDYLVWVAQQYERNGDIEAARRRVLGSDWKKRSPEEVGEISTLIADIAQARASDTAAANSLNGLRQDLASTPVEGASEPAVPGGISLLSVAKVCGPALLIVLAVALGWIVISRRREARRAAGDETGKGPSGGLAPSLPASWGADGPPQAQFVSSYSLGDDHYDPSFSIEMESGEFMGECGVGISETIGVGTPNKVTAFEVWLFDKNDIRTVTMVLMSEYAFHDEALRAKLAPKGEPVLAEVGKELELATKTLRIKARVVEAKYGAGNLPPDSFFDTLTVELAVWVTAMPEEETTNPFSVPSAT